MLQTTTTPKNLNDMALAIAMSGKSWDEFTSEVADKVADRLSGMMPTRGEREHMTPNGEMPIRGVRALCKLYGMSTATLNKMMKEDRIPFRRIGNNRFLFYQSEVDSALKGGVEV